MSLEDVARANERLKELPIPGARIAECVGRHELRWRLYARLEFSVDGTTTNGVKTEALLATAHTAAEVLEKAFEFAADPHRQADFVEFGRNRNMRGLPLDTEPLPETPEQKARTEAQREKLRRGREAYVEAQRRHMHGFLKSQGLLELAQGFHRKTGLLPNLFSGLGGFFDFGKNRH